MIICRRSALQIVTVAKPQVGIQLRWDTSYLVTAYSLILGMLTVVDEATVCYMKNSSVFQLGFRVLTCLLPTNTAASISS